MFRPIASSSIILAVVSSLVVVPVARGQATEPAVEPVFVRAQQMVTAGQDVAGRAVVDSVLALTTEGTPRYAEGLFWRATLSKTAAAAERDYRRISVEYPLSPRAQEALLRLAQLEMTRGDRTGARAHLERLQREHPTGPISTRGSVLLARLAFDDGDLVVGCGAAAAAREGVPAGDVELRNQLDYYSLRCRDLAARDTSGGARGATAAGTVDSAAAEPPPAAPAASSAARREYSVQVAAYQTRASAEALASRLSARGFAVRVVGDRAPYRVRVGRYATRELAAGALRRMSDANLRGVVVEAEPR
jgi:hypothetical protein